MKPAKTSQQLEIERHERNARKWTARSARWAAYKAGKINPKQIIKIDFEKGTITKL